jgi:methyltransferase (TIGR00027 family)
MQPGEPSRTARAAALHRAAHQLLEQGRIFQDPLAVPILGIDPRVVVEKATAHGSWSHALRFFIASRTRFAEDVLANAARAGTRQLIVLGAGLDTLAYRNPHSELRVFEVDHPATQAWKRERLAEAAIAVPRSLTYAPVDFERQSLAAGLSAAGFDAALPTFVSWLGVSVYLTHEAFWSTLQFIASLAGGAQVVFDYGNPPAEITPDSRDAVVAGAARAAAIGEAWINYLDTTELQQGLRALGYSQLEDLGPAQIVERYAPDLAWPKREQGGHLMHACIAAAAV